MNLAHTYAQALHELGESKGKSRDEIFKGFVAALVRRGHFKLLPRIEFEYQKLLVREGTSGTQVRIAGDKDRDAALKKAKELSVETPHINVDPSLVSGFVIKSRNERYDNSGKSALMQLYRKLLATR